MANLVPMVLQQTANGERAVDIFTMMLENRIIYLTGEVDDQMADLIIAQLQYLEREDPKTPITLYVNSPGGSVSSGLAMYGVMKTLSCPITTIVTGMAASMGSFLAACGGTKGMRYILEEAEHMVHQPLGGMRGQMTDMVIAAKHIERTRIRLERIYAEATGQTEEAVHEACERDNWMTAQEAVDFGLADKVLNAETLAELRSVK